MALPVPLLLLIATAATPLAPTANAICKDEPPCEPDEPGSGPKPVPQQPNLVRLTAAFSYDDTRPNGATFRRPISGTTVDVLRSVTGLLGITTWEVVTTTSTNSAGRVDQQLWWNRGESYKLRLHPSNSAADVRTVRGFHQSIETGSQRPPTGGTQLDFSLNVTGGDAVMFNVAHAIQTAFNYASHRRDSSETDRLPRVEVRLGSILTYYEGSEWGSKIFLSRDLDDATVIHEYAHFVEDKLGSFVAIISQHDGCRAGLDVSGALIDVRSPEHAFMEGFADYFAQAVIADTPEESLQQGRLVDGKLISGTTFLATLEHPPVCPQLAAPATAIEDYVAAALWDLHDHPTTDRDHDPAKAHGAAIMAILDRELDRDNGAGDVDFDDFEAAWLARGLSPTDIADVRTRNRLTTSAPPPPPKPPSEDVCERKPSTPGC